MKIKYRGMNIYRSSPPLFHHITYTIRLLSTTRTAYTKQQLTGCLLYTIWIVLYAIHKPKHNILMHKTLLKDLPYVLEFAQFYDYIQ